MNFSELSFPDYVFFIKKDIPIEYIDYMKFVSQNNSYDIIFKQYCNMFNIKIPDLFLQYIGYVLVSDLNPVFALNDKIVKKYLFMISQEQNNQSSFDMIREKRKRIINNPEKYYRDDIKRPRHDYDYYDDERSRHDYCKKTEEDEFYHLKYFSNSNDAFKYNIDNIAFMCTCFDDFDDKDISNVYKIQYKSNRDNYFENLSKYIYSNFDFNRFKKEKLHKITDSCYDLNSFYCNLKSYLKTIKYKKTKSYNIFDTKKCDERSRIIFVIINRIFFSIILNHSQFKLKLHTQKNNMRTKTMLLTENDIKISNEYFNYYGFNFNRFV